MKLFFVLFPLFLVMGVTLLIAGKIKKNLNLVEWGNAWFGASAFPFLFILMCLFI